MHPHSFRSVLTRHAWVRDYQVQQTAVGADVLVVAPGSCHTEGLARELTAALAIAGLQQPLVHVTAVDAVPRSPLGKRLLFVSR